MRVIRKGQEFSLEYSTEGIFNNTEGTIEIWLNATSNLTEPFSGTQSGAFIFTYMKNTSEFFILLQYMEQGFTEGLQLITTNETGLRKDLTGSQVSPTPMLHGNSWELVTATWNQTNLKLYLNGTLILNRSDYGIVKNWFDSR